jgi:signal transduction histidine kinase
MTTTSRSSSHGAAWLAAGAIGSLAPAGVAVVLLLGSVALWLAAARRPRRRDLVIVVPALILALAALGTAAFGRWRHPIPAARFQTLAVRQYERFWSGLEEQARRGAEEVAQRTELGPRFDAVAAFAALADTATSFGAERPGFLLLDGEGTVVAWGGSGLLREPAPSDPRRGRSVRASFGSATFFVSRPFGAEGRDWAVVAGRSVATPELPFRLPGRVGARSWTTALYQSEPEGWIEVPAPGAPTLWIERATGTPPAWVERARRLAALLWGLALLGLAASRAVRAATLSRTVLRWRVRPWEAAILGGGAALALAVGCGATAGAATVAAAGSSGALATWLGLSAAAPGWARRLVLAVPFALATVFAVRTRGGAELGLESGQWLPDAWLAFGLAALAFAWLGAAFVRGAERPARPAPVGRLALIALLSAALAAVAYPVAARWASGGSVEPVPAPGLLAAVEATLSSIDLAAIGPAPLDRLDSEDLAFALWSRTELRRQDLRSALVTDLADGRRSTFSMGLPLAAGEVDRSPALWRDLGLEVAWAEGLREGSVALRAGAEVLGMGRYWLRREAGPMPRVMTLEEVRRRLLLGRLRTGAAAPGVSPRSDRALTRHLDRGGTQAFAALGLAATLLLVGVAFALPLRSFRDRLRRAWRSYSKRLVFTVMVLAVLPVLVINLVVIQAFAARLEREQSNNGAEALRAAQRVLGEYVETLTPGFSLDTVLDDDLLRWLGRVVQRDINLYWGSRLYATSQPELFSTALLPRRIPPEVYSQLALGGASHASRTQRTAGQTYLELYAPFGRPAAASSAPALEVLILSVPLVAQQEDLEHEIASLRRRALLASAAFFVLFVAVGARAARNFTGPLRDLVDGTRRIAAGARSLGLRPSDSELQALVVAVDRMAAQIAEGRERLRRGERLEAWAEMARMIAHEIKNPLTPIRLSAEHMREVYERDPERFAPVFRRCVDNILRQVEELRSIAAEFSTYSSIPKIALERVEFGAVLRDAVGAYDSGDGARPVRLEIADHDLGVRLDPRLFVRALRNVIENALRAGGGEPVEVTAWRDGGEARVDVLDRGPGVGTDMLERIFEPYFSTHEGGTGLGLPIARRILEEHGGRLWAERREGGGLRVSMTLPIEPRA